MLSSFKDRLLNVGKNVVFFNSTATTTSTEKQSLGANANAGNEILTHFQNEWEILHEANEENANLVENVAQEIAKVSKRIDRDEDNLGLMTHIWTNSNLESNITNCRDMLGKLYEDFEMIEHDLVQLEDLIETAEFEKMKYEHRHHLEQYRVRKSDSLESFEASLKVNYLKKIEDYEARKQQELKERQQVFQEAFKTDLETFKSFGTIPKLDLPNKQPSALLEEIQVDYDEKELDQFFEDDQPSSS